MDSQSCHQLLERSSIFLSVTPLYIKENKTFIAGDALVLIDDKLVIPYPHFAYDADKAKESVKHLFSYEIEELICYHGGLIKSNWKDLLS